MPKTVIDSVFTCAKCGGRIEDGDIDMCEYCGDVYCEDCVTAEMQERDPKLCDKCFKTAVSR